MARRVATLSLALALVGGPPAWQTPVAPHALEAQERPEDGPNFASPFLSSGHWAHAALRRLFAMGLLPSRFDPSTVSITRREAARMLRAAEERAASGATEAGAEGRPGPPEDHTGRLTLIRAYRQRFAEEFGYGADVSIDSPLPDSPSPDAETQGPESLRGSGLATGFGLRRGAALAKHYDRGDGDAPGGPTGGPVTVQDEDVLAVAADLTLQFTRAVPALAARLVPEWRGDDLSLTEAYAVLEVGDVAFWGGRRAPGYGPGAGGTMMLDGNVAVNGAGLALADGVYLPGFLDVLGPLRFEVFFSRLDRGGPIEDPWFFGLRVALSPHDRVHVAINRAAMFGGDGNELDTTFGRIVNVLLGAFSRNDTGGNFENQIASAELRVLPPLGRLPLSLYLEWGFEDWAGAYIENPGLIAGAELGAIPGLFTVSIGVEWTHFAAPGSTGRVWHAHGAFADNWTDRGLLLAHALGGHGTEWRLFGRADLLEARLRMSGHVALRERGATNLLAPAREGRSWLLGGDVAARLSTRLELFARGSAESGELDWREASGFLGLRALF